MDHNTQSNGDTAWGGLARVIPEPIATVGGWNLVPGQSWAELSERERKLADLFIEMFPACVAAVQKKFPLTEGQTAYVTLGDDQESLDWEVDTDALGFHAIWAQKVDDDSGEDYLDINEHNEAVLNLAALARTILQDRSDDAAIEAALVTMPHEMVHVMAFLAASKGKTPLEIFDHNDGGEMAVKAIQIAVEKDAHRRGADHGDHGHAEDEAENLGRAFVDRWATGAASASISEAVEIFSKPQRGARPQ